MAAQQVIRVNDRIQIPLREIDFQFVRSQGPGGQNVNKVNSKAVLRWQIAKTNAIPDDVRERFVAKYGRRISTEGELRLTSQRYRDQGRNVADCLAKLQQLIEEVAQKPVKRKPTRPSRGSKERRLKGKQINSQRKQNRRAPRMDDG